jgi:hypothetical protein
MSEELSSYFGITVPEMNSALEYYGLTDYSDVVRSWYNGYIFGDETVVYNPWSSVLYLADAIISHPERVRSYWANSSGNGVVRRLIDIAGSKEKAQIEALMAGGTITKEINENLTYEEIDQNVENLWTFLYFTGYLTKTKDETKAVSETKTKKNDALLSEFIVPEPRGIELELKIPNSEVLYIFYTKLRNWFRDTVFSKSYDELYKALFAGDEKLITKELRRILTGSISYMDFAENFYQGFMVGVLNALSEDYAVKSNRESGNGRGDIFIYNRLEYDFSAILELKVAPNRKALSASCDEALQQIIDMDYDAELDDLGYENPVHYGIAFYGKECLVKKGMRL